MGSKTTKRRLRYFAGATMAEGEQIKESIQRAEQVYGNVSSILGKEGTYETPSSRYTPLSTTPASTTTGPSTGGAGLSLFTKVAPSEKALAEVYPNQRQTLIDNYSDYQVDPNALTDQVVDSPSFKIASKLTAEASQLLNREGPLYDTFKRSISGPILEKGAQIAEQSLNEIKGAFASKGRARRDGLKEALTMQAQIQANAYVGEQMAQANMNLDSWARDNARATLQFNQAWASNLQGVRESYLSAINSAREYMAQSVIPSVVQYQSTADAVGQKAKKNWVELGLGLVTTAIGVFTANPMLIAGGLGATASGASNVLSSSSIPAYNPYAAQPINTMPTSGSGKVQTGEGGIFSSIYKGLGTTIGMGGS